MIFIWRGWGPIALVALFLPLASCGGLMDWNPVVALTTAGLTLAAGGVAVRYFGRNLNRGSGFHTMYNVPLENWGWVYIVLGSALGAVGIATLVKRATIG